MCICALPSQLDGVCTRYLVLSDPEYLIFLFCFLHHRPSGRRGAPTEIVLLLSAKIAENAWHVNEYNE